MKMKMRRRDAANPAKLKTTRLTLHYITPDNPLNENSASWTSFQVHIWILLHFLFKNLFASGSRVSQSVAFIAYFGLAFVALRSGFYFMLFISLNYCNNCAASTYLMF